MWQLAEPVFLWLLLILPGAFWFVWRRRPGHDAMYPPTGHLPRFPRSFRHIASDIARVGYLAGLFLLILAMARPQTLETQVRETSEAIAIQMVVDVSGSMAGLDFAPPGNDPEADMITRLEVAKEAFSDFVKRRPNDAIGLISFGGYAVSRVPLTFDHDLLHYVLEDLQIPGSEYDREGHLRRPEEQLTAIGDALALACARLEHTDIATRVVVFLSDGESNFGIIDPEDAIRLAEAMDIRVYAIAVGTEDAVPFLQSQPHGRSRVQRFFIALDTDLLQRMANATGGRFFHVEDTEGLEDAMASIDALETTPVETHVVERRTEKMHWLLALGLFFIMGSVTILTAFSGRL